MRRSSFMRRRERVKFFSRFVALLSHPLFWFLTISGNAMIVLGSFLLYYLESSIEKPIQYIDCLLWSTSIVTTIGYVNYLPQTFFGKITVIALMLLGTFFIWAYMAFLVTALIAPALTSIEQEVQEVEKELFELKTEEHKSIKKELL